MIEVKDKKIYVNSVVVAVFDYEISKYISFEERIIVLLNSENDNNNLYCLDKKGTIIWKVSNSDYDNEECPITDFSLKDKKISAFRWCGFKDVIDIESGEVVESTFTK